MMAAVEVLADQLVQARQSRSFLVFGKDVCCRSAAEAYLVQAAVVQRLGAGVAGWKVGIGPDNVPMAAPVLESDLICDAGAFTLSGDLSSVKAEAELALRLGQDLPRRPGAPYTTADILEAVSDIFCGIELVNTRFRNDSEVDFATRLADNFAHGAYIRGSGSTTDGLDLARLRCVVWRNGTIVCDHIGGHPLGHPLIPVVAWANAQCDRLGGLRAGQFITTGTLIDPFAINEAASLRVELEGTGAASVSVSIAG